MELKGKIKLKKRGKSEEKRRGEHQFGPSSGPKEEIACFSLSVTDSRTINLIIWRSGTKKTKCVCVERH